MLFPDRLKSLEVLASEVEALELPGVRNLLQVLFLVGVDLAQLFTAACSLIVSKLLLQLFELHSHLALVVLKLVNFALQLDAGLVRALLLLRIDMTGFAILVRLLFLGSYFKIADLVNRWETQVNHGHSSLTRVRPTRRLLTYRIVLGHFACVERL